MPPRWLFGSALNLQRPHYDAICHRRPIVRCLLHVNSHSRADVTPLRKQLKDASKKARAGVAVARPEESIEDEKLAKWELTVGIEIHAQLNTIRKLFSPSRPVVEGPPNASLAPFDVALPGSQPNLQLSALVPALRAAIALNCTIQPVSKFDRKHYFYHDQPSGYQITQYYEPFARNGSILLTEDDGLPSSDGQELVVGIKQIQMEQDTAKTQESEDGTSSIDFTRSGQPLIEIISLPQIHSPGAAAAYLRKVQAILSSVDSVTTGMEFGGLRADVNVSVRHVDGPRGGHSYSGVEGLGQRTEIKNLSSFKAVEDAIRAERNRQIEILEAGGQVEGETRGWSLTHPNETRRLRGKEGEVDYRYMPDPDIPPLYIDDGLVEHLKRTMPPVPQQLVAMLVNRYGLKAIDAKALLLLEDGERLNFFQDVAESMSSQSDAERLRNGKNAGNWVLHELGALLSTSETTWSPDLVPAKSLARIVELQNQSKITGASAKRLLRTIFDGDRGDVDGIVTRERLWFDSLSDDELRNLASTIIEANDITAEAIRRGNHRKIGYFVGLMMQTGDRNRIDAKRAETIFRSMLVE